ncbi:MAG: PorV/PorQ family protein [Elusimicrobia bacterium]|nr:PorV/PorQ family protein [Elusimicrobiota bacterium]
MFPKILVLLLFPAHSCLASSFFPKHPFSNQSKGTTGAGFLKFPMSARAEALAQSYAANMGGIGSLFWNPAGLGTLSESGNSELEFDYNRLLETAYSSSLSYGRPLQSGVLGLGWIYSSQGSIDSFNTLGDSIGKFTPYDMALSLGFARRSDGFSFGATLKGIVSQISAETGSSLALDVGVIRLQAVEFGSKSVDAGIFIQNLGPPLKLGSIADPLPSKLQAGILWHPDPLVSVAMDVHAPVDRSPFASFGIEFRSPWGSRLGDGSLRVGYSLRNSSQIDGLSGMTAGLGLSLMPFRVDYAWVPFGDLGQTHRISMTFAFEGTKPSLSSTEGGHRITPYSAPEPDKKLSSYVGTTSIAVLDFKAENVSDTDASQASLMVRMGLSHEGVFRVMDAPTVNKVLMGYGVSGGKCSTTGCALKMGKALQVGRVVLGSLSIFKNRYLLQVISVNVDTGRTEHSEMAEAWTERDMWETAVRLGKKISADYQELTQQ